MGCRKLTYYPDNEPKINTLSEGLTSKKSVQNAYSSYLFGFNGKEKDDEVKGGGVQYDYGFRIYDSRLGKFLSVDPLTKAFPWWSPYHFAGNCPIQFIDLDGAEIIMPVIAIDPMLCGTTDVLISDGVKPIFESPMVRNIGKNASENALKYEETLARGLKEVQKGFKDGTEEATKSSMEEGRGQHGDYTELQKGRGVEGANQAIKGSRLRPDYWTKYLDGNTWRGIVGELKPHNLASINRAVGQLNRYVSELSKLYPEVESWTQIIETYSFVPTLTRLGGTFNQKFTVTYKIQEGDNLTKIAKYFKTTVGALAKMNNIQDPNKIEAGTTIKVQEFKSSTKL